MNYGILFLKIAAVFFCLILVLRILGKREVGELSIFDLVVLLIIADIAALGIDNDEFIIPSYFCVFILVVLQKILSLLLIKVAKFRNIIDGSPTTVVMDGKLLIKNMRKEHYTVDDLVSQMRIEHIMDLDEIKLAILETNGTLSIFRKERFNEIKLPVIMSGQIVKDSLKLLNWDQKQFEERLKKHNIAFKKIIYASLHRNTFYYYYRENKTDPELEGHILELI
ncbi:MAG: DUF421 domain-containing protein [Acholeplasmatales bacterium]|jgi:uncharacterized membrane protein YcaP (DUF421 family)|nr:DUF421 domain-containing protein [Acholeplasmatales bacterium]MCI9653184.1 DUF421 domain-containing protein [Acholeplasmatales bacterium]